MSEYIVTDADGFQLSGPFLSEELAEEAAEQMQAEGTEDAQVAVVN